MIHKNNDKYLVMMQNSTQFDSIVRALEEERDRYKAECDLLKSTKSRSTSPARFGRETVIYPFTKHSMYQL